MMQGNYSGIGSETISPVRYVGITTKIKYNISIFLT